MKRHFGFTLAEVLITLGIIGVVAALTIPVLQRNILDSQSRSAFMKEYSTAQNAFRKAAQDNGGSLVGYSKLNGDTSNRSDELKNFIKPYLAYTKDCNYTNRANCNPVGVTYKTYYNKDFPADWSPPNTYAYTPIILNDGSIWWFFAYYETMGNCKSDWINNTKNGCGVIYIDTNGAKKPNQAGYDLFEFYVAPDGSIIPMGTQNDRYKDTYSKEIGFNPRANYMLGLSN